MNALHMSEVSVRYPDANSNSIDRVTLDIARGEWVLLLGANGAGKSTLCMLTNGLIPHVIQCSIEGVVEVFGRDVSKQTVAALSTKVGIVFQEPDNQLICMSAEEEVAFGPENLAVAREEIADRVEWALDIVGLEGYNERSPASLSGGQKQRLAIAAALSMRPQMLVLDEPTYALDPVGRGELYSLLSELKKKHNMTLLVVERDAEEAAAFADAGAEGFQLLLAHVPRRELAQFSGYLPAPFREALLLGHQLVLLRRGVIQREEACLHALVQALFLLCQGGQASFQVGQFPL